mgnify:CR=1 FL=1
MSEGGRRLVRPLPLAGVLIVLLLLAVGAAGLFRVPPGEGLAVKRGATVRVYGPGWHWRLPLGGSTLPLPGEGAPFEVEVGAQTREGASVTVRVSGRAGLDAAKAQRWFAAAGWVPLADGVARVAGERLTAVLAGPDGAGWLSAGREAALAAEFRAALEALGCRVEALQVALPQGENAAVAAVARSEAVKLVQETGRRVVVLGWDAADWQLVRPLMAAGRMPNLARLVAAGASGTVRPEKPLLSPLIWTTFATGKRVSEHGIADFLVLDQATGKKVPISSNYRKVHALWTVLTALGRRTDVVGWWATWPAEPILGRMVTERVAYQLFGVEGGAGNDGKVYPESLWPVVESLVTRADDIPYRQVKRFIDISEEEYRQAWDSLPPERRQENRINHLRKVLAATLTYQAIALELLKDPADCSLFYFEGTDTIGHLFAQFLPPRLPKVSEEDVRRFGKAMPEFYVWMDELLGQLLARLSPADIVVILSDHGFYTGELRPDSDPFDWETGAPQWHRELGMIVVSGGGVRRGELGEVSPLDVTPTILALLGLPVAQDMPGKVLAAALPPGVAAKPTATIASFEALPRAKAASVERSAEADRERLRELAALGYISPGTLEEGDHPPAPRPHGEPTSPPGTPAGGEAAAPETAVQATQLGNLAASLRREGRLEEAKAKYLEAIAIAPSYFAAYDGVASIFALQGDYENAFRYLGLGLSRTPKMPASDMVAMVDDAARCGRLEQAAELLDKLRPFRGSEAEYHAAWGRLYQKRRDTERALEAYRRALAANPVEGSALQGSLELLRAQGQEAEARGLLERAFAAAGNSIDALTSVTAVALAVGQADVAEPVLQRVLAADPGNSGVLFNLGVCQAQLGKNREAEASLRQAIARSPNEASAHYNLGMVLGVEGRPEEALAALRKAQELGMNTASLHLAMARASFFLKDMPGTVVALKRALRVEPGNEEAQKLLTLLRQHGVDTETPTP